MSLLRLKSLQRLLRTHRRHVGFCLVAVVMLLGLGQLLLGGAPANRTDQTVAVACADPLLNVPRESCDALALAADDEDENDQVSGGICSCIVCVVCIAAVIGLMSQGGRHIRAVLTA